MSNAMIDRVRKHSRSKGTARVVMLLLADHHGARDPFPGIDLLAADANVDRSNVKVALHRLVTLGEIEKQERLGKSNVYKITLPCPDGCTQRHRGGANSHPPNDTRGGEFTPPGGANSHPEESVNNQPSSPKGKRGAGAASQHHQPARPPATEDDVRAAITWEEERDDPRSAQWSHDLWKAIDGPLKRKRVLADWTEAGRGPGGLFESVDASDMWKQADAEVF